MSHIKLSKYSNIEARLIQLLNMNTSKFQVERIFEAQPEGLPGTTRGKYLLLPCKVLPRIQRPRQKYNSDNLKMVKRRATRFVKDRY